jgi:Ca2+-binding RTX toxin-like protein
VFEPDGVTGWAERKLTASDGAANDFFGLATAVAGELVVVGAGFADAKGPNSGAAYIFEPDATGGWTETKLTASDGAAGDLFGAAVAASGDRVVVGAWQAGATEAGAVYVFDSDGRGGWAETRLTASDGAANNFGRSVAISGDTIVVGANGDDDIGTDAGAVYVLESDGAGGWKQTKLTAADGAEGDFLGLSVAASGTSAVAGAPRDADGGVGSGSAYLLALRPAATCNGLAATLEGSPNDDVLAGTPGDDVIVGGAGNDEIRGNGGNDTICAGDGDDTVIGGGGNDTLFGEEGNDLVKGLRGNDSVQGGPGEDRLQGNGGDDVLAGGDGKDKMWGGIGIDTLRGGVGNDQLHGGPGNDTLSGAAGTDRLWGDADDDMIGGGANSDFLYGGIGVDELRGGTGNDRIFGWTGDDRLFGEAGRDQLRGQQGDDLVDGGPDHDWCSQETVWRNCETSL